jgi:hypothetical protein
MMMSVGLLLMEKSFSDWGRSSQMLAGRTRIVAVSK